MREEFNDLLIVDDSPGDVMLLRAMLDRVFERPLAIRVAGTVAEALSILGTEEFPILLLDLGLPDSLGEATYRRVRALVPDGVIVILSGNTDDSLAVSLVREGAQDYLVKGRFDAELLRRVIQYAWERHQVEQELLERNAWWEALVQSIPDAVVISNANDRILLANPAALTLFDTTAEKIRERSVDDLHPADVHSLVKQDLDSLKSESFSGQPVNPHQLPVLGRDGQAVPTEVVRFAFQSRRERLIVSVWRDIRERKQLEQLLLRSQTMDSLGQLTAGISHDFNNLLGIVTGNLDLLRMENSDPGVRKRVDTARSAASRGADLVKRLLAFSRTKTLAPTWNSFGEVVTGFLKMASRTIGPDIVVETHLTGDLPLVYLDRAELENVLLNLTVNARDAMPRGGRLRFSTEAFELGPDDVAVRSGELTEGRYAALTVTDTGTGMPKEVLDRALEPFFTTKETGKGTGLGLSMVYGFVRQSGGTMELHSGVGVGTTVRLVFPAAEYVEETEIAAPTGLDHHALPQSVALVVDDEPALLEIACSYLSNLGYDVYSASDGPSAVIQMLSRSYSLFVTDVLMPGGLDGSQLARRARELQPGIRVVYTSGYPAQALSGKQITLDSVLVTKPYTFADFQAALNAVFAQKS